MLLDLDLLSFQPALRLRKEASGAVWVFDPIRKKEVSLSPEEHVRQLLLQYLLQGKSYPPGRIRVEIGIVVNTLQKRCDVVVYDAALQPWLLIECKSPKVALKQDTFEQAARYNLQLRAPYMAISNGLHSYCCALNFEKQDFQYLDALPAYGE